MDAESAETEDEALWADSERGVAVVAEGALEAVGDSGSACLRGVARSNGSPSAVSAGPSPGTAPSGRGARISSACLRRGAIAGVVGIGRSGHRASLVVAFPRLREYRRI